MTMFWIVCALAVGPTDNLAAPTEVERPRLPLRSVSQIVEDVDQLVRREAQATADSDRARVAYEMTERFWELKRDPRIRRNETLQGAKQRLWFRLTRIRRDIEGRLDRVGRRAELLTDVEVLAMADQERVAQGMAEHLMLAGIAQGGPSAIVGQASAAGGASLAGRGGAAGPPDYGPELVDLIQRTIVPDFWDAAGGPGTIVYYRPLMCLVVRATSDVHHRLGGTLGALRK